MSQFDSNVLGACEGLHLACITIGNSISTADWLPVHQTNLVAFLWGGDGRCAFTVVSNSQIGLLQAGSAVQFAGVTVCLTISTTDWSVIKVASDVAGHGLDALSGISDRDFGSLQTVGDVQFTIVAICYTISTTDW